MLKTHLDDSKICLICSGPNFFKYVIDIEGSSLCCKELDKVGPMIKYDLSSTASTICANRRSCSRVRADKAALGRANRSSTVVVENGICDTLKLY
jgi:hypothetical protein